FTLIVGAPAFFTSCFFLVSGRRALVLHESQVPNRKSRSCQRADIPRLLLFFFPRTVGITVSRTLFGERMDPIYIAAAIFALILIGLVVWVLVQNTQDQKKNEALESQMNELRRDLLGLSTAQTQNSTKMETIAGTVAARLEAMTSALKDGVKDSAEVTSKITSEAQSAMSTELKNTREQIGQIQKQLGEVQQAGEQMHKA